MGAEQSSNNLDVGSKEILGYGKHNVDHLNHIRDNFESQPENLAFQSNKIETSSNSPPISVCSDSDIPYISYTHRIHISDSPKGLPKNYNKNEQKQRKFKNANNAKLNILSSIVVVKAGVRKPNLEFDSDFLRLQNIPMFLPVMRGSLSVPLKKDPEILNRLHPIHLQNICSRMQLNFNMSSSSVTNVQQCIVKKIKKVDKRINKLLTNYANLQIAYSTYAEIFSKTHLVSQQLSRCNTFLHNNIASFQYLNDALEMNLLQEPFVWKINK